MKRLTENCRDIQIERDVLLDHADRIELESKKRAGGKTERTTGRDGCDYRKKKQSIPHQAL